MVSSRQTPQNIDILYMIVYVIIIMMKRKIAKKNKRMFFL